MYVSYDTEALSGGLRDDTFIARVDSKDRCLAIDLKGRSVNKWTTHLGLPIGVHHDCDSSFPLLRGHIYVVL